MVLPARIGIRFLGLLDLLANYANEYLDVGAVLDAEIFSEDLDESEMFQALEAAFSSPETIDAFIADNPAYLSDYDLETIASWKYALISDFAIAEHPRSIKTNDLLFLSGNYAFEVSGISREIKDMLTHLPCFAKTILLPYEGRIVYAFALMEMPFSPGPDIVQALKRDALHIIKEKGIVRDADVFMALVPKIREEKLRRETEAVVEEAETLLAPQAEIPGLHRGVLAGLPYDERERQINQSLSDKINERLNSADFQKSLVQQALALCRPGSESASLADMLASKKKQSLDLLAKQLDIKGASRLKKADLIDAILYAFSQTSGERPVALLKNMLSLMSSSWFFGIQQLFDSGGRTEILDTDLRGFKDVSAAVFPFSSYFHEKDRFIVRMPHEIYQVCTRLDWEALEALHTEKIRVASFAKKTAELRGVAEVEELAEAYALTFNIEKDFFHQLLIDYLLAEDTDFYLLTTPDETEYLIWYTLADDYIDAGNTKRIVAGELSDAITNILKERQGETPRPLTEAMLHEKELWDWKIKQPCVLDFVEYLDAHVPDGQNDLYFADNLVEDVLNMVTPGDYDIEDYLYLYEEVGLLREKRQLQTLLNLTDRIRNSLPNWKSNGWAPMELLEHETGQRFFYNKDGSFMNVGRNDPCPCGSGKKYKKCCGRRRR